MQVFHLDELRRLFHDEVAGVNIFGIGSVVHGQKVVRKRRAFPAQNHMLRLIGVDKCHFISLKFVTPVFCCIRQITLSRADLRDIVTSQFHLLKISPAWSLYICGSLAALNASVTIFVQQISLSVGDGGPSDDRRSDQGSFFVENTAAPGRLHVLVRIQAVYRTVQSLRIALGHRAAVRSFRFRLVIIFPNRDFTILTFIPELFSHIVIGNYERVTVIGQIHLDLKQICIFAVLRIIAIIVFRRLFLVHAEYAPVIIAFCFLKINFTGKIASVLLLFKHYGPREIPLHSLYFKLRVACNQASRISVHFGNLYSYMGRLIGKYLAASRMVAVRIRVMGLVFPDGIAGFLGKAQLGKVNVNFLTIRFITFRSSSLLIIELAQIILRIVQISLGCPLIAAFHRVISVCPAYDGIMRADNIVAHSLAPLVQSKVRIICEHTPGNGVHFLQ